MGDWGEGCGDPLCDAGDCLGDSGRPGGQGETSGSLRFSSWSVLDLSVVRETEVILSLLVLSVVLLSYCFPVATHRMSGHRNSLLQKLHCLGLKANICLLTRISCCGSRGGSATGFGTDK